MPGSSRRLAGKGVLVTGAGRGIGAAIARSAAESGAAVAVNDIDPVAAAAVVDGIVRSGGRAVAVPGDIGGWDGAGAVVSAAVDALGAVDGLVNNAGMFAMAMPQDQEHCSAGATENKQPDQFRLLLEVNVLGAAYSGIHVLRHMIQRGSGSIVNVTSSSMAGLPGMSAYGASKGAVASLTLCWAVDLVGTGIPVNGLSPIAQTRMQDVRMDFEGLAGAHRERAAQQRTVSPEFNAAPAVYLLSDASAALHGQIVQVYRPDRIGLLSHAGTAGPTVPIRTGSIDDVESAFTATLNDWIQPAGLYPA